MDRVEVLFPGSEEAWKILKLSHCPESADVIDALAAIVDPRAAERVRLHDPMASIEYFTQSLFRSLAIPKEFLGTP